MAGDSQLTPLLIDSMLEGLATVLRRHGARATLQVVGGTAMMLNGIGDRRMTADIDARLGLIAADGRIRFREHGLPVQELADEVRRTHPAGRRLAPDWLNANAQGFIPAAVHPDWLLRSDDGVLRVEYAAPRMLLAMKLRAARNNGRDQRDIAALMAHLGFTRTSEALAAQEHYFPGTPVEQRAAVLLHRIGVEDDEMLGGADLSPDEVFQSFEVRRLLGTLPVIKERPGAVRTCGMWIPSSRTVCGRPVGHSGRHYPAR